MSSYGPYTGDTYEGSPEESHDMEAEAAASFAESMEAENVNAMTEQDERTIYEWVLGHSLDKQLTVQPPDMNFAFAVCIPKLRAEGITAWFDNRDWYLDEVATENVSVDADFYDALLAYIRGGEVRQVGKVGLRRAKGMAAWRKAHPCPAVCPECGMAPDWRGFSIHHKTKRSQGGDESEDNLTWLCGRCHEKEHGG